MSLPTFSMQNRCGPFEPINSFLRKEHLLFQFQKILTISIFVQYLIKILTAKPPTGTRHVPVTNCNSRVLFSLSDSRTNCINHKHKRKSPIYDLIRIDPFEHCEHSIFTINLHSPARTMSLVCCCDCNVDRLCFVASLQYQFLAFRTTSIPIRVHRNILTILTGPLR